MTKWQKPYLDVPADDYLTSEDYLCRMGYPMDWVSPLNDLIGPHEQRYINLMRLGRKPVTEIDDYELEYWIDEIKERGYILYRFDKTCCSLSHPSYIVGLPGQEWRVRRLNKAFEDSYRNGYDEINHARIGFLLGYTKQCISAFLERSRLLKSGDCHDVLAKLRDTFIECDGDSARVAERLSEIQDK